MVLGGGLTGLSLAERLARQGRPVLVLERENEAGGICRSLRLGEARVDRYYHHTFCGHTDLLSFLDELQMSKELQWRTARQGIISGGRLRPFDHMVDHLRQTGGRPVEIWRDFLFALELARAGGAKDLEQTTLISWLSGRQTKRKVDSFWRPLLEHKFGGFGERISAAWLANRLRSRGASKRRFGGGETLGCLEGGFYRLVSRLVEKCRSQGAEIRLGTPVERLVMDGEKIVALQTDWERIDAPALVASALPLAALGQLLPEKQQADLAPFQYMGCLCVALSLSEGLSPYYWLSNLDEAPFAAIIEQSHLDPSTGHLVYLPCYLPPGERPSEAEKERACEEAITWLTGLFPHFRRESVLAVETAFDPHSQPVFQAGLPVLREWSGWLPQNLFLADPFLSYPDNERTMDAAVRRGRQAATAIMEVAAR